MICKNCGHKFEGNFCSNCGQDSDVNKINAKYLFKELSYSILKLNKGFFYTVKELFTRPGNSIRDYLQGKRKNHYKPISFVIITATIYLLTTLITGEKTFLGDFLYGLIRGFDDKEFTTISNILKWGANSYTYLTLILMPLFSFASFVSFRKAGFNYFEHLIINCYIKGAQIILYSVFCFLIYWINNESYILSVLVLLLSIVYFIWFYMQFFDKKTAIYIATRIVLAYFLYFILIGSLFIILMIVILNN
jgi:hypothetical protein